MEFLSRNFYETTTAITVNSNTSTAENLMDTNVRRQYISQLFADDDTTTSITITFTQTQTVDRIAMLSHNVKTMNVFYDGVTANTFAITGLTTASQFTNNSTTNSYWKVTPVACSSITFDLKGTIVPDSEKAVGYLMVSEQELDFARIPSAGDFTPNIKRKELNHELSDGGIRSHVVADKWDVSIKFKYIDEDFRDDLKAIYDAQENKIFVPFGTVTGWDGILFEAAWIGPFGFYKYSDNAAASGFSGSISLREA